jgi:hypothetical protein
MIVDEHYYAAGSWYISNQNRYDSYSRSGAQVFVGEYSANGGGGSTVNTLEAALAEAAFMCGLERNSDVVVMASYAPFFGRAGNSNWATNAVWLNAKNIMLTPNYHVQQMFGANIGDKYIPSTLSLSNVYHSVTQDTVGKRVFIKLVNTGNTAHTVNIDLSAFGDLRGYYRGVTMQHDTPGTRNALADDYAGAVVNNVYPAAVPKTEFESNAAYQIKKYSVSVLTFYYGGERSGADLESLHVVGGTHAVFDPAVTDYEVTLPARAAVPYVIAAPADKSAKVNIAYAADTAGTTTVTVTADNGGTKVYTLTYSDGVVPEQESEPEPEPEQGEEPDGGTPKGCGCGGVFSGTPGGFITLGLISLLLLVCPALIRRKNGCAINKIFGGTDR